MKPLWPVGVVRQELGERVVTLCAEGECRHDPPHQPLPVFFYGDNDDVAVTRWTFTDEERARVAAGADVHVFIQLRGGGFPPIYVDLNEITVAPDLCVECRHTAPHVYGLARNRCRYCSCRSGWVPSDYEP